MVFKEIYNFQSVDEVRCQNNNIKPLEWESTRIQTPVSSHDSFSVFIVCQSFDFLSLLLFPLHSIVSICPFVHLSVSLSLPTNNASQPRCFYGPVPTIYSLRLENLNFFSVISTKTKNQSYIFTFSVAGWNLTGQKRLQKAPKAPKYDRKKRKRP